MEIQKVQNLVLIGSTGSGKSSTGNMLINDNPDSPFIVGNDEVSCTFFTDEHVNLSKQIRVLDTPGFGDNRFHEKEIDKIIKDLTIRLTNPAIESTGVIDAFLLPVKFTPRPQTLKSDLEHLADLFGSVALRTLIIIPIFLDSKKRSEEEFLQMFMKMPELMRILKEGKGEEPNTDWFCLWDNINPLPEQEQNLYKKIAKLEPYTHLKFLEAAEEIKKRIDKEVKEEAERLVSRAKKDFAEDKEKLEQKIREIEQEAHKERKELQLAQDRAKTETVKYIEAFERLQSDNKTEMTALYEKFAKERDENQAQARQLIEEMNERNQKQLEAIIQANKAQMAEMQRQMQSMNHSYIYERGSGGGCQIS